MKGNKMTTHKARHNRLFKSIAAGMACLFLVNTAFQGTSYADIWVKKCPVLALATNSLGDTIVRPEEKEFYANDLIPTLADAILRKYPNDYRRQQEALDEWVANNRKIVKSAERKADSIVFVLSAKLGGFEVAIPVKGSEQPPSEERQLTYAVKNGELVRITDQETHDRLDAEIKKHFPGAEAEAEKGRRTAQKVEKGDKVAGIVRAWLSRNKLYDLSHIYDDLLSGIHSSKVTEPKEGGYFQISLLAVPQGVNHKGILGLEDGTVIFGHASDNGIFVADSGDLAENALRIFFELLRFMAIDPYLIEDVYEEASDFIAGLRSQDKSDDEAELKQLGLEKLAHLLNVESQKFVPATPDYWLRPADLLGNLKRYQPYAVARAVSEKKSKREPQTYMTDVTKLDLSDIKKIEELTESTKGKRVSEEDYSEILSDPNNSGWIVVNNYAFGQEDTVGFVICRFYEEGGKKIAKILHLKPTPDFAPTFIRKTLLDWVKKKAKEEGCDKILALEDEGEQGPEWLEEGAKSIPPWPAFLFSEGFSSYHFSMSERAYVWGYDIEPRIPEFGPQRQIAMASNGTGADRNAQLRQAKDAALAEIESGNLEGFEAAAAQLASQGRLGRLALIDIFADERYFQEDEGRHRQICAIILRRLGNLTEEEEELIEERMTSPSYYDFFSSLSNENKDLAAGMCGRIVHYTEDVEPQGLAAKIDDLLALPQTSPGHRQRALELLTLKTMDALDNSLMSGKNPPLEQMRQDAERLRKICLGVYDASAEKPPLLDRQFSRFREYNLNDEEDLLKFLIGLSGMFSYSEPACDLLYMYLATAHDATDDKAIRLISGYLTLPILGEYEVGIPREDGEDDFEYAVRTAPFRKTTADLLESAIVSRRNNLLRVLAAKYSEERHKLLRSLRDDVDTALGVVEERDTMRLYPSIAWESHLIKDLDSVLKKFESKPPLAGASDDSAATLLEIAGKVTSTEAKTQQELAVACIEEGKRLAENLVAATGRNLRTLTYAGLLKEDKQPGTAATYQVADEREVPKDRRELAQRYLNCLFAEYRGLAPTYQKGSRRTRLITALRQNFVEVKGVSKTEATSTYKEDASRTVEITTNLKPGTKYDIYVNRDNLKESYSQEDVEKIIETLKGQANVIARKRGIQISIKDAKEEAGPTYKFVCQSRGREIGQVSIDLRAGPTSLDRTLAILNLGLAASVVPAELAEVDEYIQGLKRYINLQYQSLDLVESKLLPEDASPREITQILHQHPITIVLPPAQKPSDLHKELELRLQTDALMEEFA